ncbi:hypothetical protein ACM64Y_08295 [Novispirillum sp. DQ9]|uniref:hypothetical protein n=1 Tax=Novispirillum sp. DQ9 TaxID=3398612 RepID=UPI003C7CF113
MLALSGCLGRDMAGGTEVLSDPVGRRLNWFAYLDGADIKRTCRPDGDDRARMVLNGRYTDQVRTYDLRDGGGGGTATLETHVFSGLQVNAGFTPGSLGDVLSGRPQDLRLGRAETDALWAALRASGAFEGAPKGLRLDSEEVYWIAVGCRDGAVFFNAWRHPSPGFDRLTFPEVLKRAERSDVSWPRLDEPVDVFRQKDIREGERPHFEVEVATQGIVR